MPREAIVRLFKPSICSNCRTKLVRSRKPLTRAFSTTSRRFADEPSTTQAAPPPPPPSRPRSNLSDLSSVFGNTPSTPRARRPEVRTSDLSNLFKEVDLVPPPSSSLTGPSLLALRGPPPEPHHFHVYSTKHNTHIALTRPNREPIIGLSAGNIGFRKAQRGSYDAAFQLAAYVMKMIQDRGLLRSDAREESAGRRVEHPIQRLEIILRGFGRGREAVMKALLGNEGRWLRNKVVKVSDSTRLKFGSTRSQNPRRLG